MRKKVEYKDIKIWNAMEKSVITVMEGRTSGQGDKEVGKRSRKSAYVRMKGKNRNGDSEMY